MDQPLILDRYRPLEELGEGGFGSVVLAWDTRMQRRVAIKRLPLSFDRSGRSEKPIGLSEARTAALLSHPSIVTVYDFDVDDDEAFLIMEHIEGGTLAEVLDEAGGPLDLDEAAAILEPVFDAVVYAHENGVLHLDLKPENVLVDRAGRVKVADFGVAVLSNASGHGHASGGTLGYAPIEQLEGGRATERTDVWALGVLAFETLTGENPLAASTIEDAIVRIEVEELPLPSSYVALPGAIDDVVVAALGTYPADRHRTVGAFADALLPHLGDSSLGREGLADLAASLADDHDEDAAALRLGLWDRLGRWRSVGAGALAATVSGVLAWIGLAGLGLGLPAHAAASVLVALAGALAPPLGALLGTIALSIGVGAAGAPVTGVLLGIGAGAYWWFAGRRSTAAAIVPLAAPALGAARLAPLAPLLAGFTLPPLAAASAGFVGGLLVAAAAVASGSDPIAGVVDIVVVRGLPESIAAVSWAAFASSLPGLGALVVSWTAAAWVMSLACRPASRVWAALGTAAAGIILWLGASAMTLLPGAAVNGTSPLPIVASLIIMLVLVALGPPTRAEEDRLPPRHSSNEVRA